MVNMLFTIFILLAILYIVSLRTDKDINLDFGSFYYIEVIRGISICFILLSRIGDKSGIEHFSLLGGIAVSMFLICSGYVLYKSYLQNGLDNYLKNMLPGLLIPYWIVLTIFFATNFSFSELKINEILSSFLLIKVPTTYWYVQYLVMFYVIFYLSFKFFKNQCSATMIVISSLFMLATSQDLLKGEHALAFATGVMISKYANLKNHRLRAGFIGILMISIGAINIVLKQSNFISKAHYLLINLNGTLIKTMTALGLMLIIYSVLELRILEIFTVASNYTYEIYLTNTLLTCILTNHFTLLNIVIVITTNIFAALILNIVGKRLHKVFLDLNKHKVIRKQ